MRGADVRSQAVRDVLRLLRASLLCLVGIGFLVALPGVLTVGSYLVFPYPDAEADAHTDVRSDLIKGHRVDRTALLRSRIALGNNACTSGSSAEGGRDQMHPHQGRWPRRDVLGRAGALLGAFTLGTPAAPTATEPQQQPQGQEILLQPDLPSDAVPTGDQLQGVQQVTLARLEALTGGRGEPIAEWQDQLVLRVRVPEGYSREWVAQVLGETGRFEMIETGAVSLKPGTVVSTTLGAAPSTSGERVYTTVLQSEQIDRQTRKPSIGFDFRGHPDVSVWTTEEGRAALQAVTTANVGKYVAILMDKVVLVSQVVQGPVPGRLIVIPGFFTMNDAVRIAVQLNSGPLPLPVRSAG